MADILVTLNDLPPVSSALAGTEPIETIHGGISKRVTVEQIIAFATPQLQEIAEEAEASAESAANSAEAASGSAAAALASENAAVESAISANGSAAAANASKVAAGISESSAAASAAASAASATNSADSALASQASAALAASLLSTKTDKSVSLLSWAYTSSFQLVSSTRDANSAIISANIVWPDSVTGVFTTDVASVAFPGAIDAWHATYAGSPAKLITQTTVTRDVNGAVVAQPAITIA